jgi:hypothetical protein
VTFDGIALRVPNFVTAQTSIQSDKARKRAERERANDLGRDEQENEEPKRDVTKRDGESQDVTGSRIDVTRGHDASRDVTNRSEEIRRDETRVSIPSPAPPAAPPLPAQPTAAPLTLDLDDPTTTPPKAKPAHRKASTPKPAKTPPPFAIGDAFEALASTSRGRFAPGIDRDWTQAIRIAVANRIRQYPDLDEWRLVGEWLAEGGEKYRGVLAPSWAASSGLSDAMARSREWAARGRGPIDGRFVPAAPPDPVADMWSSAAKKAGVTL